MSELNPITREEIYLAAAVEQDVTVPEPITRRERFLAALSKPSGGGVSSWNDLTDRPFYKDTKIIEILPYTQLVFVEEQSIFIADITADLTDGTTYSVNYNGTIYFCKAWDSGFGIVIGNGSVFGQEDTGEPFAALCDTGTVALMTLDGATEVFLSITGEATIVKKMPAECCPYFAFYYGDDEYIYKDAALTEKVTYTDFMHSNITGAPLYLTKDGRWLKNILDTSNMISSDGVSYVKLCAVNGFVNDTVRIKSYYTAEYTAE